MANLLTAKYASFEAADGAASSDWYGDYDETISPSTAHGVVHGSYALRIAAGADSVAEGQAIAHMDAGSAVAVTAGATYSILVSARTGGTSRTAGIVIRFYDSGGGFAGTNQYSITADNSASKQIAGTMTAPAGAATALLDVYWEPGQFDSGQSLYFDNLGLMEGTTTTWAMPGAGGTSHALAGAAAGTSTATGSLDVAAGGGGVEEAPYSDTYSDSYGVAAGAAQALAGTAAGASGAAGALAAARPLAGAAAGAAGATGTLSVVRALAGTTAGTSSAVGSAGLLHSLAGSSAGAATTAGVLRSTSGVEGLAASTSTASGLLNVTTALAGSTGGVSGATGTTLDVHLELAGTTAGVAGMAGGLAVTLIPVLVEGEAAGLSSMSGTLSAHYALEGGTGEEGVAEGVVLTTTGLVYRTRVLEHSL